MTSIENNAFEDCSALKTITIGKSVTIIPVKMFNNCTSLDNVVIPDSVNTIEEYAFANCVSLSSINFPITVSARKDLALDPNAFAGCINLKNTNVDLNISYETTYGITGTFAGCEQWTKDFKLSDDDRNKVYSCEITDVEPGTYEFKVRSNGNWTDSWGEEENGKTYNSQINCFINVTEKCSLIVEFNTNDENWDKWSVSYHIK